MRAIATRYSGGYVPPGPGPDALPRVDFWTVWNEPDYGPSLAPAGRSRAPHGGEQPEDVPQPARRGLAFAAGHRPRDLDRHDRLRGARAPRRELLGRVLGHEAAHVPARPVLRRLATTARCSARRPGCGAARRRAAASKRFRAQNPALFQASGVSDHPYMRWYKPNHELNPDPTNHSSTTDYSSLGRDRQPHAGPRSPPDGRTDRGPASRSTTPSSATSRARRSTAPTRPRASSVIYLSPATAAAYMNWAEYLSWRNPRIRVLRAVPALRPATAPPAPTTSAGSPAACSPGPARRRRPTTPGACRSTCR